MSLKFKALGLGLLAALAVSAVGVMNASANGNGHFVTTGNSHTFITGFAAPGTPHNLHLVNHGLEGEVGCATQSYPSHTISSETFTSITVTPSYAGCTTTSNGQAVPVDVNGCTYTFTVALGTTNNTEQTAHLICPAGKKIEITHPNCTVSVHPQTINTGLTYTTEGSGNTHGITMHVNIQFTQTRHGLCQFIAPTNGNGTLKGSVTVTAENTSQEHVPLTVT